MHSAQSISHGEKLSCQKWFHLGLVHALLSIVLLSREVVNLGILSPVLLAIFFPLCLGVAALLNYGVGADRYSGR